MYLKNLTFWKRIMSNSLVSVLIPLHNCALYVEEALQTILRQTYQQLEIIIIDDGSTDNTVKIVKEIAKKDSRIVFISESNKGISKTLNQAVTLSKGAYITRMDGDDLSALNRIELQKKFLDENACIDIVGSWIRLFGDRDEIFYFRQYDEFIKAMLLFRHAGFAHTTVFARRELFEKFKYDPRYDFAEDAELWSRMVIDSPNIKFANIPKVLCNYRIHEHQVCSLRKETQENRSRSLIFKYIKFFLPNVTKKEIEVHYWIINKKNDLNEKELIETGEWIRKLSDAFNQKISDEYFCISERWYRFCLLQRNDKSMEIFAKYSDSEGCFTFI